MHLDILLFIENKKKHFKHLRAVFDKLQKVDFKLKRTRWEFFICELHQLGNFILGKGIYTLAKKLHSIKDFPVPKTPKEVRQMLDLTRYYCRLIPAHANLG